MFTGSITARQFNCAMGLAVAVLVPVEVVLARVVHLGGLLQLLDVWPGLLLLAACLCYCMVRPIQKFVEVCELTIWSVVLFDVLSVLVQIAGRSPRPLMDAALSAVDGHMHLKTVSVVHLVELIPGLPIFFQISYDLILPFMLAALFVPPLMGRAIESRRYLAAVTFAAILTAILFALWPAVGPWTAQAIRPTKSQVGVTSYLLRLKSKAPVDIDERDAAIVSFPSFHVVLAILSATALGSFRRLRTGAWMLAALIGVSTVATGWHYGIDLVGGVLVAAASVVVARWATRGSYFAIEDAPMPLPLVLPEAG
jgi:membrane-associated phospholipid phosphatase